MCRTHVILRLLRVLPKVRSAASVPDPGNPRDPVDRRMSSKFAKLVAKNNTFGPPVILHEFQICKINCKKQYVRPSGDFARARTEFRICKIRCKKQYAGPSGDLGDCFLALVRQARARKLTTSKNKLCFGIPHPGLALAIFGRFRSVSAGSSRFRPVFGRFRSFSVVSGRFR